MYPTIVSVDYGVISGNFRKLQAADSGTTLVPVIKSDAYGHGAIETANALLQAGAKVLAVFRLEEAIALRKAGIKAPVWVLMGALPEEASLAVTYDFTLACFNLMQAEALSRAATSDVKLHVAVDTGMGRLGFPADELLENLARLRKLPHIRVKGIFSHIANAADATHPVTRLQVERFRALLPQLPPECTENHSCASTAWLNHLMPELPFARPGICLYARYELANGTQTDNAMRCVSRIVSLKCLPKGYAISYGSRHILTRDSLVAVVPLGYEDGYIRSLSNKAKALVHGRRVPLLGTVCMSMCMFDVTDVADVALNDEIVLLGKQESEEITIQELASMADTTDHEILCAFGKHRS